jgi:hypothetical protein
MAASKATAARVTMTTFFEIRYSATAQLISDAIDASKSSGETVEIRVWSNRAADLRSMLGDVAESVDGDDYSGENDEWSISLTVEEADPVTRKRVAPEPADDDDGQVCRYCGNGNAACTCL